MKIGMVCYPTYGGSGVVATELGMKLAGRGHEIHFISYEPPARFSHGIDGVFYHEVETISYPLFRYPPYLLAMASKMAETAEMTGLELFHVHYAIPHTISAGLAREILGDRNIPIVTTLHGTDITIVGREPAYFRVVQFALRESDGVTAVSNWLAQETKTAFGFEGHVEVIPNFVDAGRFRGGLSCRTCDQCRSEGEKLIVHVSNFRPVKRAPDVVKVFARVAKKLSARLVLVGGGPELTLCRDEARKLGVADRVTFMGETLEVERVLSCADLFLLPSETESFGLAALEAMACGVPVIATRVGGLPEVVSDGETGFLFEPGDIEGMANSAIELLGDARALAAASEAARRRAMEHFTPEQIVPRYEAFYEKILAAAKA